MASFATFSDLTNDERTRAFLCMEVGTGHGEVYLFILLIHLCSKDGFTTQLCVLSDTLTPTLHLFHQQVYYVVLLWLKPMFFVIL